MRVRGILEYRGTAFAGWQVQPDRPTIQGAVEDAIRIATGSFSRVEAAGRTDARCICRTHSSAARAVTA